MPLEWRISDEGSGKTQSGIVNKEQVEIVNLDSVFLKINSPRGDVYQITTEPTNQNREYQHKQVIWVSESRPNVLFYPEINRKFEGSWTPDSNSNNDEYINPYKIVE